jgi:hypothetical protein
VGGPPPVLAPRRRVRRRRSGARRPTRGSSPRARSRNSSRARTNSPSSSYSSSSLPLALPEGRLGKSSPRVRASGRSVGSAIVVTADPVRGTCAVRNGGRVEIGTG